MKRLKPGTGGGAPHQIAVQSCVAGVSPLAATAPTASIELDAGPAFPVLEGFKHIGVGATKGYELVNGGELQTFLIGQRRYVTKQAIQRFINKCIAASLKDSRKDRARKVEKAVAARTRRGESQSSLE